MSDKTITIPRPVVPHGPAGMTEDEGTAHYLREVLRKIDTGFLNVGGSNVTTAVRSILIDCARALEGVEAVPEPEWEYGYRFEDADGNIYKTGWAWSTPEEAQAFGDVRIVDEQETHALNEMPEIHLVLVRRPVVYWEPLPVGGDER